MEVLLGTWRCRLCPSWDVIKKKMKQKKKKKKEKKKRPSIKKRQATVINRVATVRSYIYALVEYFIKYEFIAKEPAHSHKKFGFIT